MSRSDVDIDFYNLNENKMATYCYNLAVKKSQSEFLLLLDHDDTIVFNALERFLFHWNEVPSSEKIYFAGLMSNCDDENGNLVGSLFPFSPYINGYFEVSFDDQVRGEKFFCYKTDIMKNYNFPLLDRYVPESVVMWNISEKYKTLFFNESLRIYTKPKIENNHLSFLDSFKYAKGFRHKFLELLNRHADKLNTRPRVFIIFIYNYTLYSLSAKTSIIKTINDLNQIIAKVLTLICLPFVTLILTKKKYFN
jgi:glycosyltransferase involved in cell wall biosynthesis